MKSKIFVLLLLTMILTMSAVSATEDISTDDVEVVNSIEEVDLIADDGDLTDSSFTSLNDKINGAEEGTTVTLDKDYKFNSTKDENLKDGIVISKDITIDGNGKTIDADNSARIFKITAGNVVLKNIILINGKADNGGVIYNTATLTISNSSFENNSATVQGGAIYSVGTLVVSSSSFKNNNMSVGSPYNPNADTNGGIAIFTGSKSNLTVTNSNFTKNTGIREYNKYTAGGAIYVYESNQVSLDTCIFDENSAGLGGAIEFEKFSQIGDVIKNCEFNNNFGWQGGAIYVNTAVGNIKISNSKFNNNKAVTPNIGDASAMGGAVMMGTNSNDHTEAIVENCEFIGNDALFGGALYTGKGVSANVTKSTFESNTANYGGAISANGDIFNVVACEFKNNNVTGYGGAIVGIVNNISDSNFTANNASYGGAIFSTVPLTIENSKLSDNYASTKGGAIYSNDNLTVKNSILENNIAENNANIAIAKEKELKVEDTSIDSKFEFTLTSTGDYLSEVSINGTVVSEFGNKVVLLLNNNKKAESEITDNKFEFKFSDLAAGDYKITFTDENGNVFKLADGAVDQFTINKQAEKVSITIKDITVGDVAVVVINASRDGNYTLTIGSVVREITVKGGIAQENVSGLKADGYKATIALNDENYTAENSTSFNVNKVSTSIAASALTKYFKNSKKFTVTLKDAKGNFLKGKTVTMVINGKKVTATTNNKGVATFTINHKKGNYKATVSFAGDSAYKAISKSGVSIKVVEPKVKVVKTKVKRNKYLQVSFKTYNNKPIKKTKVVIKIKNKKYTVTTNNKGIAKLKLKVKKGKYTIKASFKTTSTYGKTVKSLKIRVI